MAWSLRFDAMALSPGATSRPVGARPPRLRSKASVTEKSGLDEFFFNFKISVVGLSVCCWAFCLSCSFLSTSEDDPREWFISFT